MATGENEHMIVGHPAISKTGIKVTQRAIFADTVKVYMKDLQKCAKEKNYQGDINLKGPSENKFK
ncbi:MAG: hypothetical protein IPH18_18080 [Chitinophagaceae bacterium]|nr:hypothetical protein [Chitinophagaceae bacterium]